MKKLIIEASCGNCVYCKERGINSCGRSHLCSKGEWYGTLYPESKDMCDKWRPSKPDMRIKIQRAEEFEKLKNIRPKCEACGLIIEKEEDEMICKNCGDLVHKDCRGRTKRVCCSCSPVED